ncbi:hypothetical protein V6N11_009590 [Hibiscus sabdariffa]|uniref:Uncharacterized protein n=1 Tax=Hibiscus sabdariffa TaxID=183260 RepID=A0ABR2P686_9ROSI
MTLLTLSSSIPGLKPWCDGNVCHPTQGQVAVFFVALYLVALCSGGIKPCVSSFGAEQFDETDEVERKKKSRMYRLQKPGESPLTRICQVIVASFRKLNVKVPTDQSLFYEIDGNESVRGSRKLEHTDKLKYIFNAQQD